MTSWPIPVSTVFSLNKLVVAFHGPSGIGKSTLTMQLLEQFPTCFLFIDDDPTYLELYKDSIRIDARYSQKRANISIRTRHIPDRYSILSSQVYSEVAENLPYLSLVVNFHRWNSKIERRTPLQYFLGHNCSEMFAEFGEGYPFYQAYWSCV